MADFIGGLMSIINYVGDGLYKLGGLNCSGGVITRKAPRDCPTGYSFNDFWDPAHIGLCYKDCDSNPDPSKPENLGYRSLNWDIATCWSEKPATKPITNQRFFTCANDRENVDGLCYKKCPYRDNDILKGSIPRVPGVPTHCMGDRGLYYTTITAVVHSQGKGSFEAECKKRVKTEIDKDGNKVPVIEKDKNGDIVKDSKGNPIYVMEDEKVKIASLCYKRCSDVYGKCYVQAPGAGLFCTPAKGYSYIPPIADPACPEGYAFDGVNTCNNSYIPQLYFPDTAEIKCSKGHDNVLGLCYEKCPKVDLNINGNMVSTQLGKIPLGVGFCAPPHGNGYPPFYQPAGSPVSFPGIYSKVRKVAYSSK